MRNPPALLVIVGGEKCVMHGVPDLDNGAANVLAEPFLVTYFLGEGSTGDEDNAMTQCVDGEDLAC